MHVLERGILWLAQAPVPTPTDESFDPVDVTPGPIGFFATVLLMVLVGLIAMSLMRRSARANARFDVIEELEREAEAKDRAARADETVESERAANESDSDAGATHDHKPRAD